MAQQTINVGASPNDGTGTPLRTAFQYTNSNFSELYTATGPSGNNIVVPGSATITGDLTVRTNKLFVNATGVGVNYTSPAVALHVGTTGATNKFCINTAVTNAGDIQLRRGAFIGFSNAADNTNSEYLFANGGALEFGIGGTTRMTLDAAGNCGIAVTPSAWTSSVRAIDITSGGLGVFSGGITHNAYFDNTDARWEYKANGQATYYNLQTGIHQWFVAASGTANTAIGTFANAAMTLDASGNLLLGTVTSPTGTKIGSIAKLGGVSAEGTNYISVSTAPVALARPIGTGALFFVAGYNTAGGAQGWWLVASTGASVPTVIASGNNTLLTVAFAQVSGVLNMNTTSGTLSVTVFAITN